MFILAMFKSPLFRMSRQHVESGYTEEEAVHTLPIAFRGPFDPGLETESTMDITDCRLTDYRYSNQ
jgi:hypothetical protein